ncbi:MAG: hypothetical protein CM15mP89_4420 [Gammaproteobacteria bacterium]|nr:MAG: hypothetical protein CM15mP89_4420 [Gammaproteobacteria bacterium]
MERHSPFARVVTRSPTAAELDAVDNTDGSLDALYLLQLIYDMAPDAQVVMASPV